MYERGGLFRGKYGTLSEMSEDWIRHGHEIMVGTDDMFRQH